MDRGPLLRLAATVVIIAAAMGPETVAADISTGPFRLSATPADSFIDGPILTVAPDGGSVVYPTVEEDLVVVPIDGGAITTLSPDTLASGVVIYPEVAPDSQTVLFSVRSESANEATLHTVPIGGGTPVELIHPVIEDRKMLSGEFTPDSSRIVVRISDGTNVSLHNAPAAGGPMLDYDSYLCPGYFPYRISADSQSIVLGCSDFLYSSAITGGALRRLPQRITTHRVVFDSYEISADSEDVFYLASDGDGEPQKLFVTPIDGVFPTRLSHDLGDSDVDDYLISADGSTIIYTSGQRFWAIPAAGGSGIELTPDLEPMETIEYLKISPDGAYAIYQVYLNGDLDLYSASTLDGATAMLNPPGEPVDGADTVLISPDSSTVLYGAGSNDEYRLYSVPIAGGGAVNLSGDLVPLSSRASVGITPDSSRVVFIGKPPATSGDNIYSVPMHGGTPHQLNPTLAAHETVNPELGPQMTSDSLRAVFVVGPDGSGYTAYSAVVTRPPDLADTSISIAENSAPGTSCGYVSAADPDGDSLTFTVSGATDLFAVDAATGQVWLTGSIDYETGTSHQLRLTGSDGIFADIATVTIEVTNVNDNPPTAADLAVTVAEDTAVSTTIGMMTADDPDGDDPAFSLIESNDLFAVSPDGGITLTAPLDYETATTHSFDVEADDGVYTDTSTVTVTVTDVYEPPPTTTTMTTTTTTTTTAAPPPEFDDVPATSVFGGDIIWLATKGITKGCNPPVNDQFCPDDYVTRGQMAAFLHRALGETLTPGPAIEFSDDDTSGFETDIEWLASVGVTRGCNPPINDQFCPGDFVTRGQMAAFLDRALDLPDPVIPDLFTDDDGSLFEDQIDRLATAGITRGCNPPANTLFCPASYVTREQMAAFLHRALGDE